MSQGLPTATQLPSSLRDAWNRLQELAQTEYAGCKNLHDAMNDVAGAIAARFCLQSATAPSMQSESAFIADYQRKIERDAATIKGLRDKLVELCDRLGWKGPARESNLEITVREARALVAEHDRIAAGVAFITDTRLGGS